MNRFFHFSENGTSLRTELMAGLTTFLTMAYIVFVNPGILSAAGVPFAGAVTATALGAALMCITMGLVSNRPIALASGMGINAVITFSVIGFHQAHVPWQVGMAVILAEGFLILLLVLTGFREAVMNAIPMDLKRAIGAGIGLFIALIGLNEGGLVRPAPITLVALGDLSQPYVWVTLIGLASILAFMALKLRAALLWGLLVATAAALLLGLSHLPTQVIAAPDFSTFMAPFQRVEGGLAIVRIFTPTLLLAVFALMLTDFFDTMGTVVAVGEQAGFLDEQGRVPGLKGILTVDSLAACVGGLFGCSSITCYVESAAGVAAGGRTGLVAIVTGVLFALAAFFSPLIQMVGGGCRIPNTTHYGLLAKAGFQTPPDVLPPAGTGDAFLFPITAGALIVVGFLMMQTLKEIEWSRLEHGFPAFMVLMGIPLTYSISHGIGLGFIAHVLVLTFQGRVREIHGLTWIIAAAFLLSFIAGAAGWAGS